MNNFIELLQNIENDKQKQKKDKKVITTKSDVQQEPSKNAEIVVSLLHRSKRKFVTTVSGVEKWSNNLFIY